MTYIETVAEEESEGLLARQYAASRRRDGRVASIVSAMSQNPEALDDLMRLYTTVSRGPSGLTQWGSSLRSGSPAGSPGPRRAETYCRWRRR